MRSPSRRVLSRLAAAATALTCLLTPALVSPADAAAPPGKGKPITVMTRNIYLGADIMRPIAATVGKTGEDALLALGHANHNLRGIVDQTDFPTRGRLLAKEIAETKPDLIGLQEVALWRHGPMQLDQLGVSNATEVDYDYLRILLDELRSLGARYTAVSTQTESDVEAPSFLGNPLAGTGSEMSDQRLTIRDVVLMRTGGGLSVVDSGGDNYTARLDLSIAGIPQSFIRGYNWVDVRAGSKTLRFINTHLEAFSSNIALAQASELLAGPADHAGTTIIVCDCNSDPLNGSIKPRDTVPHWAPYRLITGAGGFTDEWLQWRPAEQGWTSGLSELVNDSTAAGFDHRIDMVFARSASGAGLSVDSGEVTGNELSDRDPATGLWPSDHAGVVIRLR